MFQLEEEINRQIALSLAKKRGPYAKLALGLLLFTNLFRFFFKHCILLQSLFQTLCPIQILLLPAPAKHRAEAKTRKLMMLLLT